MKSTIKKNTPKGECVFRRFIKTRNGKVLDAWEYGYEAWPIRIKP